MDKHSDFTFQIVSKKKKYESIDDEDLKSTFETLEKQISDIRKINLSGNSYSKEFFEQLSKKLEKNAGTILVGKCFKLICH
jgi:Ran GTPase-activating protein (RanGAP) involved in mRNA processing and transport